jgi:hypothetical protein
VRALRLLVGSAAVLIAACAAPAPSASPAGGGNAVRWTTDVVDLQASDFWIDAAGRRFVGSAEVRVTSDPGTATYRTLELTWSEHGAEMRLNIYFGGDGSRWWVDEIRTYDGTAASPDWLYYEAPGLGAALGQSWVGNLDLQSARASQPGRGSGRLHFGALQLSSRPAGP